MPKSINTYDDLSKELKKRLNKPDVCASNLINILKVILEVVELSSVNGSQKKTFAISLLNKIIDEADIVNREKRECKKLIENGTVSNTIDLVISASKKDVQINNKTKKKSKLLKNISKISMSLTAIKLQKKRRGSYPKRHSKE